MCKKAGLLIIFLMSFDLLAVPRFALLTGAQCSDCHVNPTGGLIRNSGGWAYSKNTLKMWNTYQDGEETEISPLIGKNISLGFDFRTQYIAAFDSVKSRSDFQNMTGSVYFGVALSDKIDVASRYDFVWGIWEAYAIAKILPFNGYIKAGSFQPNFGLKIDDHTAYTRGGDMGRITMANYGLPYQGTYNETGIEAGFTFGKIAQVSFSAAKPNSNTLFRFDPTYTGNILLTPIESENVNLFVGGSYAAMKRNDNSFNKLNVNLSSIYGGIGFKGASLLAEFSQGANYYEKDSTVTALMIEASYRITKGLDAVVRLDSFSGDDPNTTNGKELKLQHLIIGAEWFPYSFIEVRPQYRINTEDPDSENNAFVMQFHFYY